MIIKQTLDVYRENNFEQCSMGNPPARCATPAGHGSGGWRVKTQNQ